MPACLDVVRGWQCCHWWLAVSFLPLLCVVAVGVSCCRVVGLVVVVALCLGFGLVLWPGSLWLFPVRR